MRELSNDHVCLVSGAGVVIGGTVQGTNGGCAGVRIGQGAHVTINGKPVTPNSDSIDGMTVSVTSNTGGSAVTRPSGFWADFHSFFAGLRRGWGISF